MEQRLRVLESKGIKIYRPSKHISFALTPSRTLFITPAATCELLAVQRNSQAGYDRLRQGIEAGEYTSLCDFITDMRLQPGVGVSYRQLYNFEIERLQND